MAFGHFRKNAERVRDREGAGAEPRVSGKCRENTASSGDLYKGHDEKGRLSARRYQGAGML